MKKAVGIIGAVAIVAVAGFVVYKLFASDRKNIEAYPQIVQVDGSTYYGTGEVETKVPRKMPDGEITTFVEASIMPDSDDSANFGKEYGSLEYMHTDDGRLLIHMGEDWYVFMAS